MCGSGIYTHLEHLKFSVENNKHTHDIVERFVQVSSQLSSTTKHWKRCILLQYTESRAYVKNYYTKHLTTPNNVLPRSFTEYAVEKNVRHTRSELFSTHQIYIRHVRFRFFFNISTRAHITLRRMILQHTRALQLFSRISTHTSRI